MALYGKLEYWEERYIHSGDNGAYDWYQTYGGLNHLLTADVLNRSFNGLCNLQDRSTKDPQMLDTKAPFFPSREKCRVLILGSGNSPFGEDMRNDGWTGQIINVDFSSVVIKQMIKKQEESEQQSKMEFYCVDITRGLPFEDSCFDLIICKGTFDAILCSNGSVSNVKTLVAECHRVLAPAHGSLFLVTHGTPDNRVVFLEHRNDPTYYWDGICVESVPKRSKAGSQKDYVYICRKKKTGVADGKRQDGASEVSKGIDEENVEIIGDQNVQKPAPTEDSSK